VQQQLRSLRSTKTNSRCPSTQSDGVRTVPTHGCSTRLPLEFSVCFWLHRGQRKRRGSVPVESRQELQPFQLTMVNGKKRAAVPVPRETVSEPLRHTSGAVDCSSRLRIFCLFLNSPWSTKKKGRCPSTQ
jgi:hypothetical protein